MTIQLVPFSSTALSAAPTYSTIIPLRGAYPATDQTIRVCGAYKFSSQALEILYLTSDNVMHREMFTISEFYQQFGGGFIVQS